MASTKRYESLPGASDDQDFLLLQQIAGGNRQSYNQLFENYLPKLVYYLQPLCLASGIDYQDIIQDIFLAIWEKKETLTAIRSFDQYLFRMAKNRFLDVLRKETSKHNLHDKYGLLHKGDLTIPEHQLLFDEYHRHAQQAIQQLSPKLQTVFILSSQENLSLDEIATSLEIPKETVKKRLYLAGVSIREYLRKHADWPELLAIALFFC